MTGIGAAFVDVSATTGMTRIFMLLAFTLTLACGEVLTTRAPNIVEARQHLKAGGWWPSEIPEAATSILETHDLDTNAQKIVFSFERGACREAAARMGMPSLTTLAPVPALPLEGWPAWLFAEVDPGALSRRGATLIDAQSGALVLVCEEEKGYFWR